MMVLSTLIIGSFIAPVMAQGVTTGFILHVTFLYPYCNLSNMQLTLNDQTGRIIGTGMSPDGSEVIIPIRTETAIYSVTVRAFGYASIDPYHYWTGVYHSWPISGISTITLQTIGGVVTTPNYRSSSDYWVTIQLIKG